MEYISLQNISLLICRKNISAHLLIWPFRRSLGAELTGHKVNIGGWLNFDQIFLWWEWYLFYIPTPHQKILGSDREWAWEWESSEDIGISSAFHQEISASFRDQLCSNSSIAQLITTHQVNMTDVTFSSNQLMSQGFIHCHWLEYIAE